MNGKEFLAEVSLKHIGGPKTLCSVPLECFPDVNIVITHRLPYEKLNDIIPKPRSRVVFGIADDCGVLQTLYKKYRNPTKQRIALARIGWYHPIYLIPRGSFARGLLNETPNKSEISKAMLWIGVCHARAV